MPTVEPDRRLPISPDSISPDPIEFGGELHVDLQRLTRYVQARESILGKLPAKPDRSDRQQRQLDDAFESCRTVRRAFLARHTNAVYDTLTDHRARFLRLAELVDAAAVHFPGLVPDRARMDDERPRIQSEKEGYEVDQAIFCAAVLRSPQSGRHLIDAMRLPTPRALALLDRFRRTGRIELASVLVERDKHAARVTFRNDHCLNAEDNRLTVDLETAVDLALLDGDIHVGVLRGGVSELPRYAGKRVFNAGINLKDLRNGAISFIDFLLGRELGYINKIARGLLVHPPGEPSSPQCVQKPWIGAVETFAIGGGMQLVLVLDHVIADSDAFFSLPAAEEGIVPGLANLRLLRAAGSRLTRRMILGGQRLAATDPQARAVCDQVVPAADVEIALDRAIRDLDAPAVVANRHMLTLAEEPIDHYREYLAEFAVVQAERIYSPDVLAKVEQYWQRSVRHHEAG
jgi:thioesterase DpgC